MAAFQDLEPPVLRRLLDERAALQLIDVRTPEEVARGAIPGAQSLPLHQLPLRLDALDKERSVVFYCQSGARSAQACAYLAQHGHDRIYNLRGGILAWIRHGLPLEPLMSTSSL